MKTTMFYAAAMALALAAPAHAQTQAASATEVEGVKVTATSLEQTLPATLSQTGVKVDVISSQAIRNGGYVDVAQSLQALAPGMFILPKNGPFDYVDISLLGSRTADVLWLVDGIRINNRLYAGTTPLDTLPSSMVDHIEVLEGGQALFYGTQAVAGAVNVVTRPTSKTPDAMATIAADSNTGRHVDAYVRNSIANNDFVIYATADKTDGYRAFRSQDYQPSSTDRKRAYSVMTVGAKYAYAITSQLNLSASYERTDADLDYARPYRVAKNVNSRAEDLATLKLDYDPTDKLSIFIKSYYHNWATTYDTYYNDLAKPKTLDVLYQDAFWGYNDYGVNALAKYQLAKGVEVYGGYDMQRYGGRDDVLVITQNEETTQAAFGQLRLTPELIPKLHFAAGFRSSFPDVGRSATIWNASGQYDLTDFLYLKGDAGTNFRLPTAEELFANDPQDERGNRNLLPEESTSVNMSFGGRFVLGEVPIHWEFTGFKRDIKHLITYASFDGATGQSVFGNTAGVVHVTGGEVQVDAALSNALNATASFEGNSAGNATVSQLDLVPQSVAKASVDYHPAQLPLGLTASWSYTGKVQVAVLGKELPYGNYSVFDLSGRYFLDPARRHTLNLSLQNLFDTQYGKPAKGCLDVSTDKPTACSAPYVYYNRGLPRTVRVSYSYKF